MSLDPDIAGAQSRPLRRNVVLRTLRSGQAESAKHEGKQVYSFLPSHPNTTTRPPPTTL